MAQITIDEKVLHMAERMRDDEEAEKINKIKGGRFLLGTATGCDERHRMKAVKFVADGTVDPAVIDRESIAEVWVVAVDFGVYDSMEDVDFAMLIGDGEIDTLFARCDEYCAIEENGQFHLYGRME